MLNKAKIHRLEEAARMMAEPITPFGQEARTALVAQGDAHPRIMIETSAFGSDELNDVRKKAAQAGFAVVEWDVEPRSEGLVDVYLAMADN